MMIAAPKVTKLSGTPPRVSVLTPSTDLNRLLLPRQGTTTSSPATAEAIKEAEIHASQYEEAGEQLDSDRRVSRRSEPCLSGGGGNRTRVLRRPYRASPGAACCDFLGPGSHTGKLSTGPVTV